MSIATDQPHSILDPFAVPDVVLERMGLGEYLSIVRDCVNKGYMPSASGARTVNSKPEYLRHRDPQFPDFPLVVPGSAYCDTGCYSFDTYYVFMRDAPIFAGTREGPYQILTHLRTCQTLIRLTTPVHGLEGNALHPWREWRDAPEETIAVNRYELRDKLENYL